MSFFTALVLERALILFPELRLLIVVFQAVTETSRLFILLSIGHLSDLPAYLFTRLRVYLITHLPE